MNGDVHVVPFYAWAFDGKLAVRHVRFASVQGLWRFRRLRFADPRSARYARAICVESLTVGNRTPIARVAEHDAPLWLSDLERVRFQTSVTLGEACDLELALRAEAPSEWNDRRIAMLATFDEQPPRKPPVRGYVLGGFPPHPGFGG